MTLISIPKGRNDQLYPLPSTPTFQLPSLLDETTEEGKEGRRIGVGRRGCRGELTRVPRLPNSNLGVGRVGKWAQCGVMLRAFAIRTHSNLIHPSIS